jgi:hypothetical protein
MLAGIKTYLMIGGLSGCHAYEFPAEVVLLPNEKTIPDKGIIAAWLNHGFLDCVCDQLGNVTAFRLNEQGRVQLNQTGT